MAGVVAGPAGLAVAAPIGNEHVAPVGTTQVWIDVEALHSDLPLAAEVTGVLVGPDGEERQLTFERSPLGLTQVLRTTDGNHRLDLVAGDATQVLVAMTFADRAGNVLDEWSLTVTLEPLPDATPGPTASPDPTEPEPTEPEPTQPDPTEPPPSHSPTPAPSSPSPAPSSPSPAPSSSSDADGLATSGAAPGPWLVAGAAVVALGVGLLVRARRQVQR